MIQKLIIPAVHPRPKLLQMQGFEFGPSVAPRLGNSNAPEDQQP
jgi:hypothetical protein